ncbi:MAG TPA: thiosulfate oxidation carrier complex protein SoxZ [Gammaproteobacteria bacterium]|nr:thiosulfate oxidation carrier complex protein SoxZ [Gammaproteobacteria bacterium]
MATLTKLRATLADGITTVKSQMLHPMETGLFKDKRTGLPIPAHFIKEIKCEHNGATVLDVECGIAISKNPYLSFNFTGGQKGDTIKLSWVDNKGAGDSAQTTIS